MLLSASWLHSREIQMPMPFLQSTAHVLLYCTTAACAISALIDWLLGLRFKRVVAEAGLGAEMKKHWSSIFQWVGLIFRPSYADTEDAKKMTACCKANKRLIIWSARLLGFGLVNLVASLLLLVCLSNEIVAQVVGYGLLGIAIPFAVTYLLRLHKALKNLSF